MANSTGSSGSVPGLRCVLRLRGKWCRKRIYSRGDMSSNPDYKDLFRILNEEQVDYLVVGAHAVIYYTEPRFTKDIDILVRPTRENAEKMWAALKRFGAPLRGITVDDFTKEDLVYQVGIAPNRVDILMGLGGVGFDEAWKGRERTGYDGIPIFIIGRKELIKAKQISGRPQDLLDVKRLES